MRAGVWPKASLLGADIRSEFPAVQQFVNGRIRVSSGDGFGIGSPNLAA